MGKWPLSKDQIDRNPLPLDDLYIPLGFSLLPLDKTPKTVKSPARLSNSVVLGLLSVLSSKESELFLTSFPASTLSMTKSSVETPIRMTTSLEPLHLVGYSS